MHIHRFFSLVACAIVVTALVGGAYGRTPDDADGVYQFNWNSSYIDIQWASGREIVSIDAAQAAVPGEGWVMAIPAKAADVQIAWVPAVPVHRGRTPVSMLHERLAWATEIASATQIYPLIYEILKPSVGFSAADSPVDPHGHRGLTYDVCAATSPAELQAAVTQSAIVVSPAEMARLLGLVDGRHSFLLVHSQSVEAYTKVLEGEHADDSLTWRSHGPVQHDPCLEIRFPAVEPVLPARVMGNDELGSGTQNVCISGYVRLASDKSAAIYPDPRIRYYRGTLFGDSTGYRPVVAYSRMMYTGPAVELAFAPVTGDVFGAIDHSFYLIESPVTFVTLIVVWVALCSYVSGGLAGLFVVQRVWEFALAGLWNLGTILTLSVRLRGPKYVGLGLTPRRRFYFLLIFTVFFIVPNVVVKLALYPLLGQYSGW